MTTDAPVVIVGAGPTGVTAATLLAQYGVECLVLDRWDTVYPQPRAVHLDDEIFRILARLGIAEEFAAVSRPALGLRLLDHDHRVLAEFHRDPARSVHGFPQANMFDQPDLERCCAPTSSATRAPNCAATSRSPTSPRTARAGSGWTSPTAPIGAEHVVGPTYVLGLRRRQQRVARRHRRRPWRTSSSSSAGW